MSNTEKLHHQDLFLGAHWQVPLDLKKPISKAVADAIAQSAKEQVWVYVEGSKFSLKADKNVSKDGTASVHFGSREDLGNGKVPAQTLLYSAVLNVAEFSRPLAWRWAFAEYLKHMLEAHPDSCFSAPGPMIRGAAPVMFGFGRTSYTQLTKDERSALLMAVWVAGLELLRICRRAVQATMSDGSPIEPDPELFIELRDWDR